MRSFRGILGVLFFGFSMLGISYEGCAEDRNPASILQPTANSQILEAVGSLDTFIIDAGRIAQSHSKNPMILAYATEMIKDHSVVRGRGLDLARRLAIHLDTRHFSKNLDSERKTSLSKLDATETGIRFDREYIETEVKSHLSLLKKIDDSFMGPASTPELREFLEKTRPAVEAHLNHAQTLLEKLQKESLNTPLNSGVPTPPNKAIQ